jgi:aspartate racemase
VLWSDPRIPDRSTSIRNGDDLPLPGLQQGILALQVAGCNHIVIPCNTAHFWYDDLVKLGTPITHIVDSVATELRSLNLIDAHVGILGTRATVEMGLYDRHLTNLGWRCTGADRDDMTNLVQPAIDLIKRNDIKSAEKMLLTAVDHLINQGVHAVVLGCTELPLAVPYQSHQGIPLINSIDSLVKSAIIWYNS